jgi:hypothetical protein
LQSSLTKEWNNNSALTLKLRFYHQSEAEFYSGSIGYFTDEQYASSDRRVSEFSSFETTLCYKYPINSRISINLESSYYHQKYFNALYGSIGVNYSF